VLGVRQEQKQKSIDEGEHGGRRPQPKERPPLCIQSPVKQNCKL
jgi:hypothetical protein